MVFTCRLGEEERIQGIRILDVVTPQGFLLLPQVPEPLSDGGLDACTELCKPVLHHRPKLTEWLMLLGAQLGATELLEFCHWVTLGSFDWVWARDFSGLLYVCFISRADIQHGSLPEQMPATSVSLNKQNQPLGTSKERNEEGKRVWTWVLTLPPAVIITSLSLSSVVCTMVTVILIPQLFFTLSALGFIKKKWKPQRSSKIQGLVYDSNKEQFIIEK